MATPKLSQLEYQIMETLWSWERFLHSGDFGFAARSALARLYNHPDHRVPNGDQGRGAACQKGRQLPHLCRYRQPRYGRTPPDRNRQVAPPKDVEEAEKTRRKLSRKE